MKTFAWGPGGPDPLALARMDEFHAREPPSDAELKCIIGHVEGLTYEVTDNQGRKVALYRYGYPMTALTKFIEDSQPKDEEQ